MIVLPAHKPTLPFPPAEVAQIVVVTRVGLIRHSTTLSRLREESFDAIHRQAPDARGVPIYWTVRANGTGVIYPAPDRDYPAIVRNSRGAEISNTAKPAQVAPVPEYVAAFGRAQADAERQRAGAPAAETFGRFGKDEA